jgi:LmbE family N-acetylglucosaminyl deacetylase
MSRLINIIKNYIRKLVLIYAPPEVIPLIKHVKSKGKSLLANNVILETPPEGPVLIIAAHPDDEAIGMGGTLSKYLDNQSKVTVLYMTDGRHEASMELSKTEMIDARRKEAESLGDKYGINQIFWNIEDTCLTNNDETIIAMIKVLEDTQPAVIYLPSFFDHHYDHFTTNQILVDSFQKFPATRITINQYEVWSQIPFPNYIIDISSCFEKKKKILSHYIVPLQNNDYIKLCEYRNALQYTLYIDTNIDGYAESFHSLDLETYQEMYNDYLQALLQYGSNVPSHTLNYRKMKR